jgi:hypothetical protein
MRTRAFGLQIAEPFRRQQTFGDILLQSSRLNSPVFPLYLCRVMDVQNIVISPPGTAGLIP